MHKIPIPILDVHITTLTKNYDCHVFFYHPAYISLQAQKIIPQFAPTPS